MDTDSSGPSRPLPLPEATVAGEWGIVALIAVAIAALRLRSARNRRA